MHQYVAANQTGPQAMNLTIALLAGVGIGLAFWGGLWVSIRCGLKSSRRPGLILACGAIRWSLAGLTFFLVSRAGTAAVLAAFGGFWLTRSLLILKVAGVLRAR